jgi:hypothetical protein
MTNTQVVLSRAEGLEKVLTESDLASLKATERIVYVKEVCDSLKLNFLTRPFDFIRFQGKTILYANKGCAEQLRRIFKISTKVINRETIDGIHIVTVKAWNELQEDEASGAVVITGLKGADLANAFMKAETKAKRRVTLSIVGLNVIDESELETINAAHCKFDYETGELTDTTFYTKKHEPEVEKLVEKVEKQEHEKKVDKINEILIMQAKEEMKNFYLHSKKADNCHSFDAFKKLYAIDSIDRINSMNEEQLNAFRANLHNAHTELKQKIELEKAN